MLVAVGSLRNAARKLQVTIKDDRSVVREKMRRTPFSLMLDKIPGQQRKVPRKNWLRMGKEEASQYGRGRLELQVVGQ